jgi:hypothetical protein
MWSVLLKQRIRTLRSTIHIADQYSVLNTVTVVPSRDITYIRLTTNLTITAIYDGIQEQYLDLW